MVIKDKIKNIISAYIIRVDEDNADEEFTAFRMYKADEIKTLVKEELVKARYTGEVQYGQITFYLSENNDGSFSLEVEGSIPAGASDFHAFMKECYLMEGIP